MGVERLSGTFVAWVMHSRHKWRSGRDGGKRSFFSRVRFDSVCERRNIVIHKNGCALTREKYSVTRGYERRSKVCARTVHFRRAGELGNASRANTA